MPADEMGEKTEAPTPRRLQEARERGNVAKSQDLAAGIGLLGAVLLLAVFGGHMLSHMQVLLASMLTTATADDPVRTGDLGAAWAVAVRLGGHVLAPLALGVFALALLSGIVQVGFMVTFKPLAPKASKISPIQGFKRLFSMRAVVRFLMSMAKVAVVATVAMLSIHMDLPKLLALAHLEAGQILAAASGIIFALAVKIALVLLILGLLDFAYQKWQHTQDLKMTKQQVKDELKRMEGDPLIKQRRAQVARQLAMQRLNHDVPKADVVVTNPTHYAVALRYDEKMTAPTLVAKGADLLAMRVRQLAVAHGVPIVERPPLARAIYRTVDVGQQIPPRLYAAVAEVLAYVYRLSGKRSA